MLPVTPKTVVPLQRMGAVYCSLLLDGICFCGLGLKGAGCSYTALVQLPLCRVLVVFTVVSNGPGPDITNTSYVAAKVTFIAQGFVLVKVVVPTVAVTPPAGILYVAELDVEEIGVADSLIMADALADSPLALRQSGPEILFRVPVRVMVSVVSGVTSCASMGAKPSTHTVKSIENCLI